MTATDVLARDLVPGDVVVLVPERPRVVVSVAKSDEPAGRYGIPNRVDIAFHDGTEFATDGLSPLATDRRPRRYGLPDDQVPDAVLDVVRAIRVQYPTWSHGFDEIGVKAGTDEGMPDGTWAIFWEGYPGGWAYAVPHGGRDLDTGDGIADVSKLTSDWLIVPLYSCMIALYPATARTANRPTPAAVAAAILDPDGGA